MKTHARRFAVPALATLAGALTIIGSFLPLFVRDEPFGFGTEKVHSVIGAWRYWYSFPGQEEQSSPYTPFGIPLLPAGALLLLAAVLGSRRAGPKTTVVAAAFQLGTVGTVAMQGVTVGNPSSARAEITYGTGMWLLIAGTALAAAATALSWRTPASPDNPDWANPDAAYADTDTPPSGVVITVLPPERD
ncbi:hypothetical protein [Amycolatopsis tolypomycina]|uniref:Tryptophan-associated transmembrane protein (Trp_oprn_chp) n=1 Tax=Amycolatopsis tolypomycina TaxID=208445 RepID=A0A1H4IKZ7_9PSEU|nr:hypothetical protein [Amycolatopsis tolypomycina]SEB34759.1 hypothetical protein SAMN04489727_1060 [Amycolatopsis tolypomycina]